jgi:hypothetical protein
MQADGATYEIGVRQVETLAQQWRSFLKDFDPEVTARDGIAVLKAIEQEK